MINSMLYSTKQEKSRSKAVCKSKKNVEDYPQHKLINELHDPDII